MVSVIGFYLTTMDAALLEKSKLLLRFGAINIKLVLGSSTERFVGPCKRELYGRLAGISKAVATVGKNATRYPRIYSVGQKVLI